MSPLYAEEGKSPSFRSGVFKKNQDGVQCPK